MDEPPFIKFLQCVVDRSYCPSKGWVVLDEERNSLLWNLDIYPYVSLQMNATCCSQEGELVPHVQFRRFPGSKNIHQGHNCGNSRQE